MATAMLAPAEGAVAELALVLLLGGERRLPHARRGGAGQDGHAGGHGGGVDDSATRGRVLDTERWLKSSGARAWA